MEHHNHHAAASPAPSLTTYQPLILVLIGIATLTTLTAWFRADMSVPELMRLFMGFFFAAFAFFKFLDLKGFASAYAEYDLIAMRSRAYAFAYPFIEAALAVAYLSAWNLQLTNTVTLVLMVVSGVGVLRAVLDKRRIRCACLGAVMKLPMTTVTVIEDFGMAAMAAVMLVL